MAERDVDVRWRMPVTAYVLALAFVAVGVCLQCSLGFGLGLLCAPSLALLDPALVPVPLLVIAVLLTSALALFGRRSLRLSELGWALGGRVVGTAGGVAVVALLPTRGLEAFFGATVLAAVLLSFLGLRPVVNRTTLVGAGTVSGVMGTAVSTGAAPLAWLMQERHGERLRANLSAFFLLGSMLSLGGLAVAGHVGMAQLRSAALLLPGLLVGAVLSRWAAHVLDPRRTRYVVLAVSGLASIGLIVRAVLG